MPHVSRSEAQRLPPRVVTAPQPVLRLEGGLAPIPPGSWKLGVSHHGLYRSIYLRDLAAMTLDVRTQNQKKSTDRALVIRSCTNRKQSVDTRVVCWISGESPALVLNLETACHHRAMT